MVNLSAKSGTHFSPLALPTGRVIYYCLSAVVCFIIDERQLGKILLSPLVLVQAEVIYCY